MKNMRTGFLKLPMCVVGKKTGGKIETKTPQ